MNQDYIENDFEEEDELDLASEQVEETEEASLPDDSYSFDEENTGREEYHDAEDIGEDPDDIFGDGSSLLD